MSTVAETIADVTPEWLTEVLVTAGLDVVVTDVVAEPIGTGQIGASYRIRPTYDRAGRAPSTFVVKIAAGDRPTRERVAGGFVKEVGFYSLLVDTVSVRTPRCWHASIADDTLNFSLVLDDLAPSVPGVQRDGCSVAQAEDALRNLAGLHAPRWNDPGLAAHGFLAPSDETTARFLGDIYAEAVNGFVDRYVADLSADEVAVLQEVGPVLGDWQLTRPRPFALMHGDYRLDNLMFPPAGDGVAVLDWQTVSMGPPVRDVAYFLGNSLDVDLRRAHEAELVATYCAALREHGLVGYEDEACFDDYRLGQLQGPMITVLGCMYASAQPTPASDEMFLTMARRSCAAIRDLESLALVGVT